MLKAALLAFATALSAMTLCACSSGAGFTPSESDKLSEAEAAALVAHAKNFIAGNKRLKINEAERDCVKATQPEILIKYTDTKEGQIALSWQITDSRRLIASLDGKLISESRQLWQVQIVTTGQPVFFSNPKQLEPMDAPPGIGKNGKTP